MPMAEIQILLAPAYFFCGPWRYRSYVARAGMAAARTAGVQLILWRRTASMASIPSDRETV